MYAENVLGGGAPSKPVEVNLRAFLGHLRAQDGTARTHATSPEDQQRARPSVCPAPMSTSSQGHEDPLVSAARPASSDGVRDLAAVDSGVSKTLSPVAEGKGQRQRGGRREPREETGRDAQEGAIPQQSSASSPPAAFFGGDFMGLEGFGEDLVDNLFAPPSSSSRRRRRRLRAPAAGGVLGAHSLQGEENTGASGPYPLPPIVLVAGISGESRGVNAGATHKQGSDGNMRRNDKGGEGRDCDNGCRGVATAGQDSSLYGSSVNTTNNDVFHAFINLGRRLPGRLRR